MLKGSLHCEMVLQIDGECVVYASIWNQKGFFYCKQLNFVTIAEPFLVLFTFKKVLQGFFSKIQWFYIEPSTFKDPLACLKGSSHGEMVL